MLWYALQSKETMLPSRRRRLEVLLRQLTSVQDGRCQQPGPIIVVGGAVLDIQASAACTGLQDSLQHGSKLVTMPMLHVKSHFIKTLPVALAGTARWRR